MTSNLPLYAAPNKMSQVGASRCALLAAVL